MKAQDKIEAIAKGYNTRVVLKLELLTTETDLRAAVQKIGTLLDKGFTGAKGVASYDWCADVERLTLPTRKRKTKVK